MGVLKGIVFPKPGAYGLNTQDAIASNEGPKLFGSLASNLVIDSTGRLCSREDFMLQTAGFAGTVETVYAHRNNDGTEAILSAAAGKIYSGTSALTQRYDYSATSTTLNDWQFASLSSKIFGFQAGISPFVLHGSTYATEAFTGAPWTNSPNVILAADGRLWAADDAAGSNSYTVWWSNLLDGKVWNAGDAGQLNLRNVWPTGQDTIVALAFMSGRLVILGRQSILLYTLPASHNPAGMELTDAITNLGCRARDSVVIANGDLYFLSDDGVYKIPKLAQTISLLPTPIKISKLVADDVISTYASETMTKVRGGYYKKQKWYVLNAPTANKTYCFHLDRSVSDPSSKLATEGPPAVTTWTNSSNPFRGFTLDKDGNWYTAMTNGIGKYTGYTPSTGVSGASAYDIDWLTLWDDFQDETKLKHLKSFAMTLSATSGQTGTFKWKTDYKTVTTNTQSFTCGSSEFSDGIGTVSGQIGRSCNVAMFGVSATINGSKVTLEAMRIFAQPGATKIK